ncbi:MAG: DAK2 domain-containing protein, partial [Nocardioidaceae bacterium]
MADLVRLEQFTNWVTDFGGVIHDNAGYLTDLDSAIGDADHGINMDRGMKAAVVAVGAEEFGSPGALFKKVVMTLV